MKFTQTIPHQSSFTDFLLLIGWPFTPVLRQRTFAHGPTELASRTWRAQRILRWNPVSRLQLFPLEARLAALSGSIRTPRTWRVATNITGAISWRENG